MSWPPAIAIHKNIVTVRQTEFSCGELKPTPNGAVVFKDSNTAGYVCNYGYKLVGESKVISTSIIVILRYCAFTDIS